mgnify:CR=1 FL=1
MVEFVAYPTAWYWYMSIGLAAVCLGIPIFLIYWVDKRKRRSKVSNGYITFSNYSEICE